MGNFERAAEEFSKGVEPDLQYAFTAAHHRAFAILALRDLDRYQEACARLVEVFHDNPVPSNRNRVAWLCSLAPNRLVDADQVVQMARAVHPFDEDDVDDRRALTLGASLYRGGQREEAVRVLTDLTARLSRGGDPSDRHRLACATYFLSLARDEMGHAYQARRLLAEANRIAGKYASSSYSHWMQPVELDTLRREASDRIAR